MDSLSLTVATRTIPTLATAIKDVIEVAEKIEASFVEVSQNLRTAQAFASEIRQKVHDLKGLCEEHYDTLNASSETKSALQDLNMKMWTVHQDCIQLFTPSTEGQDDSLEASSHSNENCEKIEEAISELRDNVKKCYADFMLFTLMKIETKLAVVQHSNTHGMEIVKREVSAMGVSDRQVIAFAESSSETYLPILRTPTSIRDEVISDMYLRVQIDSISDSLSQLSSMDLSYIPEPAECYIQPFRPLLDSSFLPGDKAALHRDIVSRSLEIRNILENEPTEVSIQEGAYDLVNLTIGLYYLNMHQEAANMGQWTVTLFRTLVDVNPTIYTPYLIHTLKHLSRFYEDVNNPEGAFAAIEEATELSRSLQTPTTSEELRVQYGGTLTTYARSVGIKKEHARAIELAQEALKILEDVIQVEFLPSQYTKVDDIVEVNPEFLNQLYFSSATDQAVCNYARALRQLSNCYHDDGQVQESLDTKLRALPIFQAIPGWYTESTMDVELAGILYEFISQPSKKLLPNERLLTYAEDCIVIYRKYVDDNPAVYGRYLCDALWEKANILGELKRDDDALEVWKEIAELAKKLLEDQMYLADALYQVSWSFRRLKRHDEAATTRTQSVLTYQSLVNTSSSTQANGYYDLSYDLQLAGRYPEAVEAAQNALTQYRALAFEDPDRWSKEVGRALSALANSYLSAGQCDHALNEGYEALSTFEQLIVKDPTVIQSYVYALRVNLGIAITSENEPKALERSRDVIRHFRALSVDFAKEIALGLWEAELELCYNFDRFNRVPEARRHMEEILDKWEDTKHAIADEAAVVAAHIGALITHASILDNQGHTELALAPMAKAVEVGTPLIASNAAVASQTIGAMYRHAHLLCELGRYEESLEAGQKTLEFARNATFDNLGEMVGCFLVVAMAADHNYKPELVVEIAQEAVDYCRGEAMQAYTKINKRALFSLPRSLCYLAGGLADCGKTAEGLQYAREAVEESLKFKNMSRMSWKDAEPVYMSARASLGTALLVNNDIAEALDITVEMKAWYIDRVKERNGAYSNVLITLRRLGILYCSLGRHDEGIAEAEELSKVKTRLNEEFPSLARLVELDLEHDMKAFSMKVLRDAKANLQCCHQENS